MTKFLLRKHIKWLKRKNEKLKFQDDLRYKDCLRLTQECTDKDLQIQNLQKRIIELESLDKTTQTFSSFISDEVLRFYPDKNYVENLCMREAKRNLLEYISTHNEFFRILKKDNGTILQMTCVRVDKV